MYSEQHFSSKGVR